MTLPPMIQKLLPQLNLAINLDVNGTLVKRTVGLLNDESIRNVVVKYLFDIE